LSALADLETALRGGRAYAQLADSHVHRATREDSLGLKKGRDAITAAWVNEDAADITISADLGEMIAYKVNGWPGHRWVWREEGRILREVVVEDRGEPKTAAPVHPPLGELRAARGQYAAGDAHSSGSPTAHTVCKVTLRVAEYLCPSGMTAVGLKPCRQQEKRNYYFFAVACLMMPTMAIKTPPPTPPPAT